MQMAEGRDEGNNYPVSSTVDALLSHFTDLTVLWKGIFPTQGVEIYSTRASNDVHFFVKTTEKTLSTSQYRNLHRETINFVCHMTTSRHSTMQGNKLLYGHACPRHLPSVRKGVCGTLLLLLKAKLTLLKCSSLSLFILSSLFA